MKYKALRDCKFDKKYSYGDIIPDSVADQGCFANAIKFGYIEEVETVEDEIIEEVENDTESETDSEPETENEPVETQEASEIDSEEKVEERPEQKRRGRKKANEVV